jgi:hypothetical protein
VFLVTARSTSDAADASRPAEPPVDPQAGALAPPLEAEAGDARPMGAELASALIRVADGRLGEITWFRTDWQRGGALTGYADFTDEQGRVRPVVVKLPVAPAERRWLLRLQGEPFVPFLHLEGATLLGYDIAWLVMERLPHGPLGPLWESVEFDLLADAAGAFYAAASAYDDYKPPPVRDWERIYKKARDAAGGFPGTMRQTWNTLLKKAHKKLPGWVETWEARPSRDWIHGDLHLANALTREPPPAGPAVLIDFSGTRSGHWLEDAVYFEHLFWGRPDRLEGRKLCSLIARRRKDHGLSVDEDWSELARVRRAMLAMAAPLTAAGETATREHLEAAMRLLEREVK